MINSKVSGPISFMHKIFLTKRTFSGFVSILILCFTYAVVGRLALMLAIPPGYATAIFPSAGIAVAALLIWGYRLWPGVFLGSILLNLWISIEQDPFSLVVLEVSVGAAIGAALQALAGAWLVRRVVGYPTPLAKEQEIFRFMLMAGPVACLVSASFGATSLLASGVISENEYVYSWFTWWIGDTIGVLITAPLMFIFYSEPKALWWSRRASVAIPLLFMLAVVIVLFVWVSKWEYERSQFDFREAASDTTDNLRASFGSYLDAVASIERLFVSSSSVTRGEFRSFVENMLSDKPGIQGLGWNPIVLDSERDNFELNVREEGFPGFQITERDSEGQLVSAAIRDEYVVATYLEPMKGNKKAFGFDVASNSKRSQALIQARDSGQSVATARITLVQGSGKQAGFLLFHPVYDGHHDTQEARRRNLKGYAVGVFRVGDIVDAVLLSQHQDHIVLGIYDETTSNMKTHLYGPENRNLIQSDLFDWSDTLEIGGRRWALHFWPSANYLASHLAWQAWAVLAAGLIFTSMLGAFLLSMTGRSYEVAELVTRRTAELSGILSTAIEAIITLDEHGIVESINPAGELLFGYTSAELSGQSINMIIPDFFTNLSAGADRNETCSITGSRLDTYAIRKGETKVPIELATSTLVVSGRTLYTAIIHDLTERTKVNRMKDEFVSAVSHELRTPLTSILGSLRLITGGAVDLASNKGHEMIRVAINNSERLIQIVNDILDTEKLEFGKAIFNMQSDNLLALLSNSIEQNKGYAQQHKVSLKLTKPVDSSLHLYVDSQRFQQVMANLISNAIKFSPAGANVKIWAEKLQDRVKIFVHDHGDGIPDEFRGRIFQKFAQANSSDTRLSGGTGLGLSIVKAIVEQMGGNVGYESTSGKGTTFYFDLPTPPQDSYKGLKRSNN